MKFLFYFVVFLKYLHKSNLPEKSKYFDDHQHKYYHLSDYPVYIKKIERSISSHNILDLMII
jgi:hypothetical protein